MERLEINYLILAHKNLGQTLRMITELNNENTNFFVHFDLKSDLDHSSLPQLSNVVFVKNRFSINWGGFNMVNATLELLKTAFSFSSSSSKTYFILLSGQDFPIKNTRYIYNYLNANYGYEYIEHFKIPNYKAWKLEGGLGRINYRWFIDDLGLKNSYHHVQEQKKNGSKTKYSFQPYGGSQWWCLTLDCVNYILNEVNNNRFLCDFFKYTLIPDEIFFQTIIQNSPFKKNVKNDNLRYLDWESGPLFPKILIAEDFLKLKNSKNLFARKFDILEDIEILTLIELNNKRI